MQTIHKSINAIYCDDIRNEIGGKLSFMGVYGTDMIIPNFPAAIGKLCVYVSIKFPFAEHPKEKIYIAISEGDKILSEMRLEKENLEKSQPPPPDKNTPPKDQSWIFDIGFTISPLNLSGPTQLNIVAELDGKTLHGNQMKIRLPTPEEKTALGLPFN